MVTEHESLLSREIKALCGYGNKQVRKSTSPFDSWDSRVVKELQGDRYGWGIARYITPEAVFSKETIRSASHRTPTESRQRLINHLTKLLPQATPKQILDIIG